VLYRVVWRFAAEGEINGTVEVAGVMVRPGDLVVADDTGLCMVPFESINEVLQVCLESDEGEQAHIDAIDRGLPAKQIVAIVRPEGW
jgi:regulator of RNase E activity RraA